MLLGKMAFHIWQAAADGDKTYQIMILLGYGQLYETKVRKVLNWALKKVINSEKSFNIELVRGNLG